MSSAPSVRPTFRTAFICTALFAGTVLLFSRAANYGFINYDDPFYVTNNPAVQGGLTWSGVVWAFTAPTDYWHPLTWLSHMLDWQLYGAVPFGHHLTSILWHALNAVLVFLVLRRFGGGVWLSAFAAAVFAWHPLRVESVVWITERKDVMSGCFFLLTVLAYARYAARRDAQRPSLGAYLLTLASFVAGLMSKPMLVTLPLVLLLLDVWPLRRFTRPAAWPRLVVEKLPLFALSAATSVVTIALQRHQGAFVLDLPFTARAANAVVSVARYLGKFFWPFDLIVCYPHPGTWPLLVVLAAGALVISLTALAWWQRRDRPWLLVGWFWLLVVLLPAIGLVQVGFQAMADRYTYLALLGIEIALLWSIAPRLAQPRAQLATTVAALLVLAAGAARTWSQQGVWRDSVTLFRHALASSSANPAAEDFLSYTLLGLDRLDEAESHAERARALDPRAINPLYTLGRIRERQGRVDDAIGFYREALARRPDDPPSRYRLGLLELARGHPEIARPLLVGALQTNPSFREDSLQRGLAALQRQDARAALFLHEVVLAVTPDDPRAHFGAALAAGALDRPDDALIHYQAVVRLQPDVAEAQASLGAILLARSDPSGALPHLRAAVSRKPGLAQAQLDLAHCAEQLGQPQEAIAALERAASAAPDVPAIQTRAAELAARLRDFPLAARLYRRAVELTPDSSQAHAALGYMLVLSGDRAGGLREWERALELQPDFPGLRQRLDRLRRGG